MRKAVGKPNTPKSGVIDSDEGRFVCGKPWINCHAERGGKAIPITEKLLASTIWWWRKRPVFDETLHKDLRLSRGLVTKGAQHEWRLQWESALFFYELHARLGNDGFIFDAPILYLPQRRNAFLLRMFERQLRRDNASFENELVLADLKTSEGRELAYNALINRKSGHKNTYLSRRSRPWRLIEALDKKILLISGYVLSDGERSGLSKLRGEYLKRLDFYSSLSSHEAGRTASCHQIQKSSTKARRKTP